MNNQDYTPLDKYKQHKKILTPPLAQLNIRITSWADNDLPEMLWAALAACAMPREEHLSLFRKINRLCFLSYPEVKDITITGISLCSVDTRSKFLNDLLALDERLRPILTPLLLFDNLPGLAEWKRAIALEAEESDGMVLAIAVNEVIAQDRERATDLQWLRLICFSEKQICLTDPLMPEELQRYPDCRDYAKVGSFIRAHWNGMRGLVLKTRSDWSKRFWLQCHKNTPCWTRHEQGYRDKIKRDTKSIEDMMDIEKLEKVRNALRQHFFDTQNSADQDIRHQIVFGIAFYAHDVFITNAIYRSALTIVGRVNLRIILEAYFNLAYMLHEEKKASNTDIWTRYRDYGAGRFTSIYKKLKSSGKRPPRLLNVPLIELIANEDKWNELREINYGDWRGKNLKKISKEIGQKELYDRYYEYLSDYVHVTWGSVRKSSMQKCCNILHRGHIIPSETMVLQLSTVTDCKRIMNRILKLVDGAYPGLKVRF